MGSLLWKEDKRRFMNARQDFNFQSLTFEKGPLADAKSTTPTDVTSNTGSSKSDHLVVADNNNCPTTSTTRTSTASNSSNSGGHGGRQGGGGSVGGGNGSGPIVVGPGYNGKRGSSSMGILPSDEFSLGSRLSSVEFSSHLLNLDPSQRIIKQTTNYLNQTNNPVKKLQRGSSSGSKQQQGSGVVDEEVEEGQESNGGGYNHNSRDDFKLNKLVPRSELHLVGRDEELCTIVDLHTSAGKSVVTVDTNDESSGCAVGVSSSDMATQSDEQTTNGESSTITATPNYPGKKIMITNIVGKSGSGKSLLAQEVQRRLRSYVVSSSNDENDKVKAWFCGSGKFDIQNRSNPYQAITEALEDFIDKLPKDQIQRCQDSIQNKVGEDVTVLLELGIHSLERILPAPSSAPPPAAGASSASPTQKSRKGRRRSSIMRNRNDGNCGGGNNSNTSGVTERASQIQMILLKFLSAIATAEYPVSLKFDDIQWAGHASLAILEYLLDNASELPYVYFITTCRLEYFEAQQAQQQQQTQEQQQGGGNQQQQVTSQLSDMLEKYSASIHQVPLDGLSVSSVKQLINAMLRMEDDTKDRTKDLATIVHSKTGGNPFFVTAFMQTLVDEKLLKYSLGTMSWEWYEVEISSKSVADNIAEAVTKRLNQLDEKDLFLLQVASCLSRTFELHTIQFLLAGLYEIIVNVWRFDQITNVEDRLSHLVDMGVIENEWGVGNTKYAFVHDQIQQAAFNSIPTENDKRMLLQVSIGQRLIEGLDANHMDQFLFTAVGLVGIGMPKMQDRDKHQYAFWAFLAANAAMMQGAFDSAYKFYLKSMECLGSEPFEVDYELALPLHWGICEASYCLGKFDEVATYAAAVHNQGSKIPPLDTIRVTLIEMKVDQHVSPPRYVECLETYRNAVKSITGGGSLGKLPRNPSTVGAILRILGLFRTIKSNYSKEKLLEIPECEDPKILAVSDLYRVAMAATFNVGPNHFIVASVQAMHWSLKYGVTRSTPIAWASIAVILTAIDLEWGMELGEAALELCELRGYRVAFPFVLNTMYGYVRHWKNPVHQFESPFLYGIDLAKRCGDLTNSGVLMQAFSALCLLGPRGTFPEIVRVSRRFRQQLTALNDENLGMYQDLSLQYAWNLAYPAQDQTKLIGEFMDQEAKLKEATEKNNFILVAMINYHRLHLLVTFEHDPLEICDLANSIEGFGVTFCQGNGLTAKCSFLVGLVNVQVYEKTGKMKHYKVAKAMRKRMKNWIAKGNPNVLHFLHTLEAEMAGARNKFDKAREEYHAAMSCSARSGFRIDFAYANHRCSLFHLRKLKDTSAACHYMSEAVKTYDDIGAMEVAKHLRAAYPDLLPTSQTSKP